MNMHNPTTLADADYTHIHTEKENYYTHSDYTHTHTHTNIHTYIYRLYTRISTDKIPKQTDRTGLSPPTHTHTM